MLTSLALAPRIGWYVANVCFTQIFLVELLLRWFVEGWRHVMTHCVLSKSRILVRHVLSSILVWHPVELHAS